MTAERTPIDEAALRARILGSGSPWRRIDVVAETGSTNADLVSRAARGDAIGGDVLVAEYQTAGRGRQGRSWADARGAAVAVSVGVDGSRVPAEQWGWLTLATGVAVVDTVAALGGPSAGVGLKWPNDVLADGRKLAGILAEVAVPLREIVVGVGINVTLRDSEVDAPEATSLAMLGVPRTGRTEVVAALLEQLGRRVGQWQDAGQDAAARADLIRDYRARSLTLGARVRAILPDGNEIVGVAVDVDGAGRLCIQDAGSDVHVVAAGDVKHLRPAS